MPQAEVPPAKAKNHCRHRVLGHAARWLGESIVVFAGVYAAFALNRWQGQQQDQRIRQHILKSLDDDTVQTIENARVGADLSQHGLDEFERQLNAGEMPELRLASFASDYDPTDDLALSEVGADRLLDYQTLRAWKKVIASERQLLMMARNHQQLGNELIAPHLGEAKENFYDLQTRQLRSRFGWYLPNRRAINALMHDYQKANENLLAQLRAEEMKRK